MAEAKKTNLKGLKIANRQHKEFNYRIASRCTCRHKRVRRAGDMVTPEIILRAFLRQDSPDIKVAADTDTGTTSVALGVPAEQSIM